MNKILNAIKKYEDSSYYILTLGLISALFFSATFVINRAISLDGGHWYFTGALRFVYIILFLSFGFIVFKGFTYFKLVIKEFSNNFIFWIIAGTLGFGLFYAPLCYAFDYAPGWIVATTWELTIIASLIVLHFFGQKVSKKVWLMTIIIFIGVTLVNLSHFEISNTKNLLLGFLPVVLAAFAYPLGNQMVWNNKRKRVENKEDLRVINNAFAKLFLLILGSFPIWIVLYFFTDATIPSNGQYLNVAIVSLISGVIATSIFLYIRSHVKEPSKLMIVDASQSGEVFFTLFAEVILLGALFPNFIGIIGILLTTIGLALLTKIK